MKVLKFGGSSVAKPDRIVHIGKLLKKRIKAKEKITVVFSAFGGVTDELIRIAKTASNGDDNYLSLFIKLQARHVDTVQQLIKKSKQKHIEKAMISEMGVLGELLKGIFLVREASPRTMDYLLSFGERCSNYIIANYLTQLGIDAEYVDARKIIKTDKSFGSAKVNFKLTNETIQDFYKQRKKKTLIVTGFIGSDIGGLTTTLGRGGSDYTAAILASALETKALEIWTDVDGVLTCDPRKVKHAYTIDTLTYNEAMELSHFGAKVIYPPTIQPALSMGIPIYIKNTFNPGFPGTLIGKQKGKRAEAKIKGLSSFSGLCLLTLQGPGMMGIPGTAARLTSALASGQVNIVMITQASSEHSICLAIKEGSIASAKSLIAKEFEKEIAGKLINAPSIEKGISLVAIVGEKMKSMPGIAGKLFQSLGRNGINVIAIAQGSSELNITFAIHKKDETKALNLIHDSFFLSEQVSINLFVVGVGLIGGTLLEQIKEQHASLLKNQKVNIKLAGIANSRKMAFSDEGFPLIDWKEALTNSSTKSDIVKYVKKMNEMNLPNSIFVDNTAGDIIAKHYKEILQNSISISTPNKVATSSSYKQYEELKKLAKEHNVQFRYETNVGAGLPVLSTLRDLINSGDKILKIEAVLSGSVSYIFNNFVGEKSFHSIVKEAKTLGLTEPDPREDLSGNDIRRKITILAREAGFPIEPKQVKIEQVLPAACRKAKTIKDFMSALKKSDSHFSTLLAKATKKKCVLRYIAKFQAGKASIDLKAVNSKSPFYGLEGSDNMIVLTTKRYKERPLVIKGPGAGAEVTAAGIFSEIINIGTVGFAYN